MTLTKFGELLLIILSVPLVVAMLTTIIVRIFTAGREELKRWKRWRGAVKAKPTRKSKPKDH